MEGREQQGDDGLLKAKFASGAIPREMILWVGIGMYTNWSPDRRNRTNGNRNKLQKSKAETLVSNEALKL